MFTPRLRYGDFSNHNFVCFYRCLKCEWRNNQNRRVKTSNHMVLSLKVLENYSWCAGKSLNFGANCIQDDPDSQVPNRSKHRKTFRIKLLMLWKNLKRDTLMYTLFLHWMESLKMGSVSLKVLKKSLNFLFKKGYEPCNALILLLLNSIHFFFIVINHEKHEDNVCYCHQGVLVTRREKVYI